MGMPAEFLSSEEPGTKNPLGNCPADCSQRSKSDMLVHNRFQSQTEIVEQTSLKSTVPKSSKANSRAWTSDMQNGAREDIREGTTGDPLRRGIKEAV
jgi:hypothetical protein